MILVEVVDHLRVALKGLPGLRVVPWGVREFTPPAALIGLPQSIMYDQTYGRGLTKISDVEIMILVGKPDDRASVARLAGWTGENPGGVKHAVEGHDYAGACDDVRVVSCEFEIVTQGGNDYACATFHTDIYGRGQTA